MRPQTAPSIRDRFVGFAFAAADMLVEIDAHRRIIFAAGAFQERFGADGECFRTQPFNDLIAPEDRGALEIAMSLFAARGRLLPVHVRLANPARTPMALSGLQLPHREDVSWLTLARLPAAVAPGPALAGPDVFREAVAARGRSGLAGNMGLVEVGGWSDLEPRQRRGLEESIAEALRDTGGHGAVAAEMAAGRFGVLGDEGVTPDALMARIGSVLRKAGNTRSVAAMSMAVHPETVPEAAAAHGDAIRAMRFALACFSAGGTQAVHAAGLEHGLDRFLHRAEARAGSVRSAIERGRFKLVFQPVVRLGDASVHHYEALLRPYPIAGHENASTQEFVRFAEAVGLAELLDTAVMRRAAATLKSARARVAVNVSGLSMQSAAFRETLLGIIEECPEVACRLLVELTETADIDDVPAAVETVARISAAGIPICLDDFGAGYAAFRYLREFKVDFVKIDGSFVRAAAAGSRESGFVGAMVELARCVGAQTIAEMVETEAQAAVMRDLGVGFGQGWLFGRPGGLPGNI